MKTSYNDIIYLYIYFGEQLKMMGFVVVVGGVFIYFFN